MDGTMNLAGGAFNDAWLERLLHEDAAQQRHIDDDGFSARVLAALPPPQRRVGRWLVPGMTLLGCAIAAFVTPAGEYLVRSLIALTDFQHFSAVNLLALVPIGLLYVCSIAALREN